MVFILRENVMLRKWLDAFSPQFVFSFQACTRSFMRCCIIHNTSERPSAFWTAACPTFWMKFVFLARYIKFFPFYPFQHYFLFYLPFISFCSWLFFSFFSSFISFFVSYLRLLQIHPTQPNKFFTWVSHRGMNWTCPNWRLFPSTVSGFP